MKGKTCPIPVIETRRALKNAPKGSIVEIIGTHKPSKYEIPMAVEALKMKILSIEDEEGEDGVWRIKIQVPLEIS
ncbi:MAG: sulfurtransferase TusA family protein [Candidatus Hodarchaeota archaeon]